VEDRSNEHRSTQVRKPATVVKDDWEDDDEVEETSEERNKQIWEEACVIVKSPCNT